ncbi:tetratricopeptide repeat protein [Spirosoma agri]|uniref:Tetratricopeptide repeat protein n=1 Tax=Spirosoma agri TaxID=1987381 RepID=A0A6M0IPF7_9BACT|nr:tetratricopeptide repeat protein [Spirosoma agri]NEU69822.1 tetratricopeptide repeat protein [Spirosoma agri]
MNTDLETIEQYLTNQLSAGERAQFESALETDPAVADALAFYVLSKQVAKAQAREERIAEFKALRQQPRIGQRSSASWITYAAAAASIVLLLGLGWYFFRPATDATLVASQQVDSYVSSHFMQLPTMMDSDADSLKTGVDLFNKGNLTEAGNVFQAILTRHPDSDTALKFAGIVAFQQGNYDKAIDLFHRLSQRTDLFANPGLFYESLALLKRGRPIDKSEAKKLLDAVITKNLEGKREAEELVKQL